jgi:hypothetical protein
MHITGTGNKRYNTSNGIVDVEKSMKMISLENKLEM